MNKIDDESEEKIFVEEADDEEQDDEEEIVRIGEYDSEGNSTGACPRCGVSPVYEYGLGGGTCGHYLALYDDWGGQSDFSELPALPCLDKKWQPLCSMLFPEDVSEYAFAPHPELTNRFGPDLPLLVAWLEEGLCTAPAWNGITRELFLTEENGVEAVGYNTGTVYYDLGERPSLRHVVARLTQRFQALSVALASYKKENTLAAETVSADIFGC